MRTVMMASSLIWLGCLGCSKPKREESTMQTVAMPVVMAEQPGMDAMDESRPGAGENAATTRVVPTYLQYLGGFRLPRVTDVSSWEYGTSAKTFNPEGNPKGPDDGFP